MSVHVRNEFIRNASVWSRKTKRPIVILDATFKKYPIRSWHFKICLVIFHQDLFFALYMLNQCLNIKIIKITDQQISKYVLLEKQFLEIAVVKCPIILWLQLILAFFVWQTEQFTQYFIAFHSIFMHRFSLVYTVT